MKRPPIVILAGSDSQPAELPASGKDKRPLRGYKGADLHVGGRPIVAVIAERLASTRRLGPIYVAGPASRFLDRVPGTTLIETDGSFGGNIRRAIEHVTREHGPSPIAFTVCDILPGAEVFERMLADYERTAPCDLWFPLVRAPEDRARLGAAAWKPFYRIAPRAGESPVPILPGHLAVVDPAAFRAEFVYGLMDIGYRTRNRPIRQRRSAMVRQLLGQLIGRDLKLLAALEPPTLTWTVATAGLSAAHRLRRGTITREGLEDALRKIFVTRTHRRRFPGRRVVTPIVDELALALDIDTEEEARALGGDLGPEFRDATA